MIGQTISHYNILEKLGEGGMGVVYKAHDTKLDRTVALKFLPPAGGEKEKARLIREARAVAQLDHPNICTVHEIGDSEGVPYIAMAYIEGETLKDRVENGPLAMNDVIDYAGQIARGLQSAHRKQIIHRDIKSANIMITPDGQIKIMDFGLAKLAGRTQLTQEGSTAGTVMYMSPEQARGEDVDHRTDIWSFGVVLYEMLTGRLPFQSEYETAAVYSILNEDPPPIGNYNPDVPPELEAIVMRTLQKNKEDRYQQLDELLSDLDVFSGTSVKKIAWRRVFTTGRKPFIYAAAVFLLLLVVAAILSLIVSNIGGIKQSRAGSIESIVILPFGNYTGVDTLDHFISGMHSTLINEIGKIHGLRIISKVSSDTYKNTGKSIPQIAKELKVDAVLELGVLSLGDTIWFQPRLISGSSQEKQLWVGDFRGAKGNLFNMFNQVIRQIAEEVRISLSPKEEAWLAESRIRDREAVDAYLKAYDFIGDLSPNSLSMARDYLNSAIEKEPEWAELHAALGLVWFVMGATLIEPPEIAHPIVIEHSNKALELDPDLPEAHYVIAFLAIHTEWNMEKAEKGFLKALSSNPSYALARMHYSWLMYVLQRPEEAKMQADLAYSLDPLNPLMQNLYAVALELDGDCASAVSLFKKVLASDPDNLYAHRNIEVAAFQCGDYDVVMEAFKHILPIEEAAMNEMVKIYNERGFTAALEEIMPHLEKIVVEKSNVIPSKMAFRFYMINQDEKAMEWLEKAAETGDGNVWLFGTKVFPFTRLHDNPGFIEILRRFNLPLPKS